MKVIFFAQSREAAGCDSCVLPLEKPLTDSELWTVLLMTFPQLAGQEKTARLARRESYLQPGDRLYPDDEIAVIPPVSGG